MPFPEAKRVIYKKNPLDNVICQFRFPPILKIDSEVPSIFQEIIRGTFPLYLEKIENKQVIPPGIKSSVSTDLIQLLAKSTTNKNHEFATEDGSWKVNLTRTFISLSTSKYTKWEDFQKCFNETLDAFIEVYKPPFFGRIGLRYIDIFNRSQLGIANANWDTLIEPRFLGVLSSTIALNVENFESVYEVKLADGLSKVRISNSFAIHAPTNEQCFMVDSDFYLSKRTSLVDAASRLDFLHQRATRLIRWIISDQLHKAMEPQEL